MKRKLWIAMAVAVNVGLFASSAAVAASKKGSCQVDYGKHGRLVSSATIGDDVSLEECVSRIRRNFMESLRERRSNAASVIFSSDQVKITMAWMSQRTTDETCRLEHAKNGRKLNEFGGSRFYRRNLFWRDSSLPLEECFGTMTENFLDYASEERADAALFEFVGDGVTVFGEIVETQEK